MDRAVVWTETAWSDLDEAAQFIAKDSPNYAAAFVREVRDAARSLATFSQRGRVVAEFDDPNIRQLLVRNYRLIYRLTEDTVYVIGFIHGARDLRGLWELEGREPPMSDEG